MLYAYRTQSAAQDGANLSLFRFRVSGSPRPNAVASTRDNFRFDVACRNGLLSCFTELRPTHERLQVVHRQARELEQQRVKEVREKDSPAVEKVRKLLGLRAIGIRSSWLYVHEFFGWRKFRNRKQVGSLAGLTPTPYASGQIDHEQGISKAGNPRMRWMAIEIAWAWLRYQPDSELSRWFYARFGRGSSRQRRIGIVALARKLLVALWRYVTQGVVPQGAVLKA